MVRLPQPSQSELNDNGNIPIGQDTSEPAAARLEGDTHRERAERPTRFLSLPRQLTVFLKVYLEPGTEHTVRGLAAALNVSKPAVTRALDRLAESDFIKRETDRNDRRSVIVGRTLQGSTYLGTLNAV